MIVDYIFVALTIGRGDCEWRLLEILPVIDLIETGPGGTERCAMQPGSFRISIS